MCIGAGIASIPYMTGTLDTDVTAREYQDPQLGHVIECDTLLVKDHILVSPGMKDKDIGPSVFSAISKWL